ncbi:AarF/ABC1/UbiB kinase family protein [Arthrobacter sp. 24S4-2]|uniref:ABC1 kinase family protein n=1 Tax=Arthrobacter sp. 24S4-2 TaxID=2575374 RepID=UPI0015865629|nr:AarF/UbiB family protein [Arthrobacter sp. 24S4-2]
MDPERLILITGMIGLLALTMMLLALLSRRILGVRIGAGRTVMALIVAVGRSSFSNPKSSGRPRTADSPTSASSSVSPCSPRFCSWSSLNSSSPRSAPPPHTWLAGLRAGSQRGARYSRILRIGAKHGLFPLRSSHGPDVNATRARSLRLALEEAGATFVKFGQMLSTRPDLLPPEYITELSRLQQHVAPVPWDQVRQILEEDAGRPVAEVFADFDEIPLAAASIGQVHRATLHDGSRVAVKVQRPNIRHKVSLDLDIAVRIGRKLEKSTAFGRSLGTEALALGFAENLREELDYEQEARNIIALRTAVARHPEDVRVVIPFHVPELCTSRVLVMEMLDGRTFSDPATARSMETGTRTTYAARLMRSLLRQIMIDGTFHADPHPGNIIVLTDGRLGLVDFGSVGRLDHDLRTSIRQVVLAIDRADAGLLVNALFEVVIRPDEIDVPVLKRTLSQFMGTSLQPGVPLDLKVINELVRILARFDLAIPRPSPAPSAP